MTSYTMNGHKHSTMRVEPEILLGIARNQIAKFKRARLLSPAMPEKFRCLESPDSKIQLQEALRQIDDLLNRNMQLLETVFLLGQALGDPRPLIYQDQSISRLDQDKLRLSHDVHGYIKQLGTEIQQQMLR